jgi:hypothetical protein
MGSPSFVLDEIAPEILLRRRDRGAWLSHIDPVSGEPHDCGFGAQFSGTDTKENRSLRRLVSLNFGHAA